MLMFSLCCLFKVTIPKGISTKLTPDVLGIGALLRSRNSPPYLAHTVILEEVQDLERSKGVLQNIMGTFFVNMPMHRCLPMHRCMFTGASDFPVPLHVMVLSTYPVHMNMCVSLSSCLTLVLPGKKSGISTPKQEFE